MTIRRDELSKIDFSDVSSGKRLAPVQPGNVLLKDIIEPILTSDGLGNIAKPNQCLVK